MATAELNDLLTREHSTRDFTPYHEISADADALTVYFRPDADYSKRLTDHVTLYLSIDGDEIVGCRIKGIAELLEDLPNYIRVNHNGVELSVIFWSFRGAITDDRIRDIFNRLAKAAEGMLLSRGELPCIA